MVNIRSTLIGLAALGLRGGTLNIIRTYAVIGGGSQLSGIEEVASKVLGQPVRRAGFPPGISEELAQPENSTVLGLLHYGLEDQSLPGEKIQEDVGLLGKLGRFVGIGG